MFKEFSEKIFCEVDGDFRSKFHDLNGTGEFGGARTVEVVLLPETPSLTEIDVFV